MHKRTRKRYGREFKREAVRRPPVKSRRWNCVVI
jgi:hypothetical protein